MARPISEGFVPWPTAFADAYRAKGYWRGKSLGEILWAKADRWPDGVAIVDGDRRLTYAEMCVEADATASALVEHGVKTGDRIVVQLPNCADFVVTLLGCLRSGVVPVMALPAHRSLELRHMIEISEASAIVVADAIRSFDHQAMALELMAESDSVENVFVVGSNVPAPGIALRSAMERAQSRANRARWDASPPDAGSVALFLLSGGTTGMPKLIPRTHDDYAYNAQASAELCGMNTDSVYLVVLPASHNFPLACPGILGTFLTGGTAVMLPSPEPERVFRTIEQEGVTMTAAVPAVAQRWMDSRRTNSDDDLSTFGLLQVGGARIADEVARRVTPVLGAKLQQVFGMAEGLLNYTRLDDDDEIICSTQGRPLSPDDEVRIVDEEDRDVPDGLSGSLLTRGPYTPRGYYRAPEQNARAFTAGGWYRSGDIVRQTVDGYLIVEGRDKDIINRGGEKISAEDVENLAYGIPDIALAAAVGMPDAELGERLCLYVVLRNSEATMSLAVVRDRMDAAGVNRNAWPERLEVVSELPTTKVGKIDKKALREDIVERIASGNAVHE